MALVKGVPSWEGVPGKLGFPKGRGEDGDATIEATAARETFQETGLSGRVGRRVFCHRTDTYFHMSLGRQAHEPHMQEHGNGRQEIASHHWVPLRHLRAFVQERRGECNAGLREFVDRYLLRFIRSMR